MSAFNSELIYRSTQYRNLNRIVKHVSPKEYGEHLQEKRKRNNRRKKRI